MAHPLAKPILKTIPEPRTHPTNANGELTRHQENAGVGVRALPAFRLGHSADSLFCLQQYDAARVYLAKWARVVAEEGERARRAEYVFSGPGGRQEDSEVGAFEVLSVSFSSTQYFP